MTSNISGKTLVLIFTSTILLSCLNQNPHKMTEGESKQIIKEVKSLSDKIIEYTQRAQLDSLLSCYDNSPTFLAFSSDGKMRNYEEFKKNCTEYYNALKKQKVLTTQEEFHVIDENLVILGWSGDIIAELQNGDTMKMKNYSVTFVFKKIDTKWKIIHSHESALPPEIIKKG